MSSHNGHTTRYTEPTHIFYFDLDILYCILVPIAVDKILLTFDCEK